MVDITGNSDIVAPAPLKDNCGGGTITSGEQIVLLHVASVGTNKYGERRYADPIEIGVTISELTFGSEKTGVRSGSGFTSSKATEITVAGRSKLLIGPTHGVKINDKLTIFGENFSVETISPKVSAGGCDSHSEYGIVAMEAN